LAKVILVNPAIITTGYSFITPRWLYVLARATPEDLVGPPILVDESIIRFDPDKVEPGDIVGIGLTTGNCMPGYRVLKEAKARNATVIVGGIHATIFPHEPLEMGADAVVTGAGDVVWREAVSDALSGNLKRVYVGGQAPGEKLIPARWDLLDPKRYMFASVSTVAGCPENCSFCSVWVTDGRRPRLRLTENIIDEVNTLYRMGFRYLIFADDNFNPATVGRIQRETSPSKRKELEAVREQRLRFFEEYSRQVPRDIYGFTQMTSEVVSDPEYLKAIHDQMRVRAALIGVESFSAEGLKSANKQWNPVGDKMVQTIRTIQENGIFVLSSIICGLETDTIATIETMREFAKESGSLLAQFTLYSPFPGTVDFLEMMQDRKVREQEASSKAASAPKHLTKILYDKFWLSSTKPAVLIEHPNMDEQTLIREIKKSWASFYNWKEIRRRAQKTSWPLVGKIWYALACFGFKALYAGYGFSADSVKTRRMKFLPSVALKAAVLFHNTFFRKPVQHAPVIPNRIPDRIISPPELEERVESHAQI
jgi:radical SAM superfamily enzyme YgiQ (UPF0313 family)